MKKILFITLLTTWVIVLQAQSLEQGKQQLYYERYQSAENTFQQLVKQDPNNAEAWYGLVEAYIADEKLDKANAALQQAPAEVRTEPYFKIAYGSILMQQGKNAEAAPYFNEALEQTKEKDADILAAIADAHIHAKTGDGNYAIELLNKAIKRDKKDEALYVKLGEAYEKMHNGSEAYKAYQQAIEQNDKYALAYHRIGEIFLTQKNPDVYLEKFQKAVAADPAFAPSLYQLYVYNFYHNPSKALAYYNQYTAHTDTSIQNRYDLADLFYLNKQYDKALQTANEILVTEGSKTQPRLYKLIGYSYAGKSDSAKAISYMQQYFAVAPDSLVIAKDYETMSQLFKSQGNDSLMTAYLAKAAIIEKDSTLQLNDYKKLATFFNDKKEYDNAAKWWELYYTHNKKANNLDLYYWAVAHYMNQDYAKADSVFGLYVEKYPEQSFGYYWQARSKALLDSGSVQGLAVPAYQKLIEVLQKDTTDKNYKPYMVEAYAYLAAYEANQQKDYATAVDYFEKLLQIDPDNADAKKYIAVLEENLDDKNSK